jgi:hypothetical protein
MQDVKHFINGRDLHGEYHMEDLDEQINMFLNEHPNYSVTTLSTIIGPAYKEAFVVFDVMEEPKEPVLKDGKSEKLERNERPERFDRQKNINKPFNSGKITKGE